MELILLPLLLTPAFVSASPGDRSYFYQNCLKECGQSKCEQRDLTFPSYSSPFSVLPCALKCKSDCISEANEEIQGKYKITVQFHGKWPFRRLANCEEIASVLFSIGNSLATIIGYWAATGRKGRSLPSSYKTRDDFYAQLVRTHAAVCALVWLFSAQFHARDTLVAERLDYFGAGLMLYITLYVTLWRNFPSYKNRLLFLVLFAYCCHVTRLIWKFDYGLNMKLCVLVGLASVVLWLRIALVEGKPHLRRLSVLSLFSSTLVALELLDFPPIAGIFDAHALWHAATMPLPIWFYSYIRTDIESVQKIY